MPGTYKCMETGCLKDDAEPIFTAPLSSITRRRATRQPKWYCEVHRRKYHRVSATLGVRVQKVGTLHRRRHEKEVKDIAPKQSH